MPNACVVHQLLGSDGVAPARPRKLINQAEQGVGGRRMQRWISLSYFTALLISTFIDGDYPHSLKDYSFCNMRGTKRHSLMQFIFRHTNCTFAICASELARIDAFQVEGESSYACFYN